MKASPQEQRKLLNLQDIDLRLIRITRDAVALRKNAERDAVQAELAALRTRVSEAQHAVDDARAEVNKFESDVKLVDDRLERNAKLLAGNLNAKETQSIEAEVLSLQQRKVTLEDAELEHMQVLENAEKALNTILGEEQSLVERIEGLDGSEADTLAALEQERAEVLNARTEQVAAILPELYELYEKQRERYGYGASELRGQLSSAAGVELSTEDFAQIQNKAADEVLLCPESQAILVRGGVAE